MVLGYGLYNYKGYQCIAGASSAYRSRKAAVCKYKYTQSESLSESGFWLKRLQPLVERTLIVGGITALTAGWNLGFRV